MCCCRENTAVSTDPSAGLRRLANEFTQHRGRVGTGDQGEAQFQHIALPAPVEVGHGQRLATGRNFMLGDKPGLPDAVAYYLVWFTRGRWQSGAELLAEFPALEAWEKRVAAIGHGDSKDMTAGEALDIAKASATGTPEKADPRDPQGIKPGMTVSIVADVDGGETPVTAKVRAVDRETISVLHDEDRVGTVCIHFPRVGYRVTPV